MRVPFTLKLQPIGLEHPNKVISKNAPLQAGKRVQQRELQPLRQPSAEALDIHLGGGAALGFEEDLRRQGRKAGEGGGSRSTKWEGQNSPGLVHTEYSPTYLVALLFCKSDNFVLDGGAIPRTLGVHPATINRGLLEVLADQAMSLRCRVSEVARYLTVREWVRSMAHD